MEDANARNREVWDEWSDEHQSLWNAATDEGGLPPVYSPLPDAESDWRVERLPELDALDFVELGCGGGQGTVGAAREGVRRAVGVDFSRRQLRHARHLRDLYGVEAAFVGGDVTALPFADERFDLAHSGFVYFMVEDLEAAFAEAHRVLRDGGVLAFDVPHPVHELFDPETLEIESSYHDTAPRTARFDGAVHDDTVVFDRRISDLHGALVDAGFTVTELWEWPESDDPSAYDEEPANGTSPELKARVPRTLGFRAVAE